MFYNDNEDCIVDCIKTMIFQEDNVYKCSDYLQGLCTLHPNRNDSAVTEDDRHQMANWFIQVANMSDFSYDTILIGMSYLDRYLCTLEGQNALLNKKEFQLASICAFNLAVKLFESKNKMSFHDLSMISSGAYTVKQMEYMERSIITSLQWRLNPPTAMGFMHQFLNLLFPMGNQYPLWKDVFLDFCRWQMEYVAGRYTFVGCKNSLVAAASILNTMELLDSRARINLGETVFEDIMKMVGLDCKSDDILKIKTELKKSSIPGSRWDHSLDESKISFVSKTLNQRLSKTKGYKSPVSVCSNR